MLSVKQIQEILSLYRKHDWNLRRVLLSEELRGSLNGSLPLLFGTTETAAAEIDALWFSRPSDAGREAWEIRHLSPAPFALIEVFDAEDDEEVRNEARYELEQQLKGRLTKT